MGLLKFGNRNKKSSKKPVAATPTETIIKPLELNLSEPTLTHENQGEFSPNESSLGTGSLLDDIIHELSSNNEKKKDDFLFNDDSIYSTYLRNLTAIETSVSKLNIEPTPTEPARPIVLDSDISDSDEESKVSVESDQEAKKKSKQKKGIKPIMERRRPAVNNQRKIEQWSNQVEPEPNNAVIERMRNRHRTQAKYAAYQKQKQENEEYDAYYGEETSAYEEHSNYDPMFSVPQYNPFSHGLPNMFLDPTQPLAYPPLPDIFPFPFPLQETFPYPFPFPENFPLPLPLQPIFPLPETFPFPSTETYPPFPPTELYPSQETHQDIYLERTHLPEETGKKKKNRKHHPTPPPELNPIQEEIATVRNSRSVPNLKKKKQKRPMAQSVRPMKSEPDFDQAYPHYSTLESNPMPYPPYYTR